MNNALTSTTLLSSHFVNLNEVSFLLEKRGSNRAPDQECQIDALNDVAAVECWLNEYRHVITTYRSYRHEAQRFLLWCGIVAKKTLSELKRNEFEAYSHFLIDPQPRDRWCGPRSRHKEKWKPFVKGLSHSAAATAMTILQSLMNYLVQAGYLLNNPLLVLRKKVNPHAENLRKINALARRLEEDEIVAVLDAIEALPEVTAQALFAKNRFRFLVRLLMLTGMRNDEIVNLNWSAFRFIQGRWWLFILGKGNKPGFLPINDEALQVIKHYRQFLGKPPYPTAEENSPLLTLRNQQKRLSTRQINRLMHQITYLAAEIFSDKPDKCGRIKRIAVHGCRHIFATLQEQADVSLVQIRDNMRHSDLKTTSIYLHSSDLKRHAALQNITLSALKNKV